MKLFRLVLVFGVISLFAVLARASTFRDESFREHEALNQPKSVLVQIRGQLTYSENGVLKIREKDTGRTFKLTEEDADDSNLMQKYNAGQRDVAVEGTLVGNNTLAVKTAGN